jgi:hypothetical protein
MAASTASIEGGKETATKGSRKNTFTNESEMHRFMTRTTTTNEVNLAIRFV